MPQSRQRRQPNKIERWTIALNQFADVEPCGTLRVARCKRVAWPNALRALQEVFAQICFEFDYTEGVS